MSTPPKTTAPARVGPYRLVRRIGSGGMATVFEAEDERLGQRVALKRLHAHVADRAGAPERFLREGRAVGRIRHPHIVRVISLGEADGSPYLVMELLEGEDLGVVLERQRRLGVRDAVERVLPIVAAVAAAHDAGVIHRDIKPPNIFITSAPGGQPWPKIVDFGVSKLVASFDAKDLTGSEAVLGTAAYMAPEQARCVRNASFSSDQYALGVVLYQCVTGQLPFRGHGVYELFEAIMTAPVVAPSALADGIPEELEAAILRAMHRDPQQRFPSLRAFGVALLPFAPEQTRVALRAELEAVGKASAQPETSAVVDADLAPVDTTPMTATRGGGRRAAHRASRGALALAAVTIGVGVAGVALSMTSVPREGVGATLVVSAVVPALGPPPPGPLAPTSSALTSSAALSLARSSATSASAARFPPPPPPPPSHLRPRAAAVPALPRASAAANVPVASPAPPETAGADVRIGDNGAPILP